MNKQIGIVAVSILFSSLLFGCGKNVSTVDGSYLKDGIINGEAVADSDDVAPGTVNLYFSFPNSTKIVNFCTGTVISKTVILTAAHCFVETSKSLEVPIEIFEKYVVIGFGTNVVASRDDASVVTVPVAKVTVHEDYKSDALEAAGKGEAFWDVAVVKLAKEIPASAKVIPMLEDGKKLAPGTEVTLVGFGLTKAKDEQVTATHLNKTQVNIEGLLNPTQFIYLTKDGHTSCSGDSGGPAYLRDSAGQLTVAGITSWGDQYCEKVGIYTSVPAVLGWIKAKM